MLIVKNQEIGIEKLSIHSVSKLQRKVTNIIMRSSSSLISNGDVTQANTPAEQNTLPL